MAGRGQDTEVVAPGTAEPGTESPIQGRNTRGESDVGEDVSTSGLVRQAKPRSRFVRRVSFSSRKRLIRIAFDRMIGMGLLLRLGVWLLWGARDPSSTEEKPLLEAATFAERGS